MPLPNRWAPVRLRRGSHDRTHASVEEWCVPTLSGTWANYGTGYNTAGYWKDPWGIVHLRGLIEAGALGSTITTLPVGYRPAMSELFCVRYGGAAFGSCRVQLTNAGVLSEGPVNQQRSAAGDWLSLDAITFRAAEQQELIRYQ